MHTPDSAIGRRPPKNVRNIHVCTSLTMTVIEWAPCPQTTDLTEIESNANIASIEFYKSWIGLCKVFSTTCSAEKILYTQSALR